MGLRIPPRHQGVFCPRRECFVEQLVATEHRVTEDGKARWVHHHARSEVCNDHCVCVVLTMRAAS